MATSQASSSATAHTDVPHLVEKIEGFPLNVKLFSKYCNLEPMYLLQHIKNSREGPPCTIVAV